MSTEYQNSSIEVASRDHCFGEYKPRDGYLEPAHFYRCWKMARGSATTENRSSALPFEERNCERFNIDQNEVIGMAVQKSSLFR